jgi:hypothetical protein
VRRLLLIAVLASCGGRARPDPGPDPVPKTVPDAGVSAPDAPLALEDDVPTLATRIAEMIDALAAALESDAAARDCAALAGSARAVLDEHRVVRDAAAEAARRGRERDLDAALEAHASRIAAAVTKMRPALAACGADATFAEAITPFDL